MFFRPEDKMYRNIIIKKIALLSLAMLILAICSVSCSAANKTLTGKNNGDNLNLKINDEIEIKLESNPTTGYSWVLSKTVDDTIVSVTGPKFIESDKDEELVGVGGYETFTLKAISSGKTDIILNYEKSWEEGAEPIDTFKITISVE